VKIKPKIVHSDWSDLFISAQSGMVTRRGGDAHLLARLPGTTRDGKPRLVRDALCDVGRRLLKRKKPDGEEETETDDPQHQQQQRQQRQHGPSPSEEQRDLAIPTATAPGAPAAAPRSKLGKRDRHAMGQDNIAIHEDPSAATQHLHVPESQIMTEHDPNLPYSDEDDDEPSEDEVDDTVAEDMKKLEENFKGISQKYRLINRIGEGMLVRPETRPLSNPLQAPFPPSTKPNASTSHTTKIARTNIQNPRTS